MKANDLTPLPDMSPLFSIVTITFNNRRLLTRTAQSIAAQTADNFEWIVIDGGSTDGTVEDIPHFPRLSFWMSERDKGIADAWNKGILRATGKHVVILNSGDTFDPDCLEKMSGEVCDDRITCCHARLSTEEDSISGTFLARPQHLWRGMHLPHNWAFVPRHFYTVDEFGLYQHLRYSMDFEWFHRFYRAFGSDGFNVSDQVLGTYYLGGLSDTTFAKSFQMNEDILRQNGTSFVVARLLRWGYTAKHWLVHRALPLVRWPRS